MPDALLAATPSRDDPGALFRSILPWLLLLLGMIILAAIIVAILRRMNADDAQQDPDPFTLQGLREMLATGQISQEEFDRMKAAMIERVQSKLHPPEEEQDAETGGLDPEREREARRGEAEESGSRKPGDARSSEAGPPNHDPPADSPSADDPPTSPGNSVT